MTSLEGRDSASEPYRGRTHWDWDDARPGFVEVDTVAHCGATTEGFHLWTVTAVDVATGWVDMDVVWGKTQERVGAAIRRAGEVAVPLLGLDSDNGTEFINRGLIEYCEKNKITLTRSRPYDSAHVEQKNGAVVRRLTGHARYSTSAAFKQMRQVYSLARLQAQPGGGWWARVGRGIEWCVDTTKR